MMQQPLDFDRLIRQTFLQGVEHHAELSSTQARAHETAALLAAEKLPLLIVADCQTAGRGRGHNRWWTGLGGLAFSLIFDPAGNGLAASIDPRRSLAAAVAIIDTVRPWLDRQTPGLHWPNDVFVSGRKLAGILIDVLPTGRHILGIGLNTNHSFAEAPPDVQARAVSLTELAGRPFDHTAVLLDLLRHLDVRMRQLNDEPVELGRLFNALCLQTGQPIAIESGGRKTIGVCLGIEPSGALKLQTDAGPRIFFSGVLCHDAP